MYDGTYGHLFMGCVTGEWEQALIWTATEGELTEERTTGLRKSRVTKINKNFRIHCMTCSGSHGGSERTLSGVGGKSPWLRALTALAEVLRSVSSTPMVPTSVCNENYGGSDAFWP